MKVLFDISHPAHVHFFKNMVWQLTEEGHDTLIVARDKAIYVKGTAIFGPNIAWGGTGDELVQIVSQDGRDAAAGKIIVADPRFQNASAGNLRVKKGSPATSAADNVRVSTIGDFVNRSVRGAGPELGAFEL